MGGPVTVEHASPAFTALSRYRHVQRSTCSGARIDDFPDRPRPAHYAGEQALALPPDNAPLVVITGMNRGHSEDLTGLKFADAMRRKWPALGVVYLAALWPVRLHRCALAARDRFLAKPVSVTDMVRTVRELMAAGLCRQSG